MLDIAFLKLPGGAEEELLAREMRFGMDEGHRILQLIAESERATRLIVSAPGPQAAGERAPLSQPEPL